MQKYCLQTKNLSGDLKSQLKPYKLLGGLRSLIKKSFVKAALNENIEVFVMYIASLTSKMLILLA